LAVLVGVISLNAPANPDQKTISGTLSTIGPNTLSLDESQNHDYPYHAATEIWRRGQDRASAAQLVADESLYAAYTETAKDGLPITSATERSDSIALVPHYIVEYRGCGGLAQTILGDVISVKNGAGLCGLHVNAKTDIWRDASAVRLGDDAVSRAVAR
jgi:hypothetical protein